MLAPLGMVFAFGAVAQRTSAAGAQLFFYVYAALMGASLSSIFWSTYRFDCTDILDYSDRICRLSLWGYTTKKDIFRLGSFLIMGVISLIVASIVELFPGFAIHFCNFRFGVLIFAGLTAYQHIQNIIPNMPSMVMLLLLEKSAIFGVAAVSDFVNLFMFLLQFLGNRE